MRTIALCVMLTVAGCSASQPTNRSPRPAYVAVADSTRADSVAVIVHREDPNKDNGPKAVLVVTIIAAVLMVAVGLNQH